MNSLKALAMAPVNKIRDALKEGLTPEEVALSLSAGLACGIFPLCGTQWAVGIGLQFIFKALIENGGSFAIIQAINMILTPVEIMLIPFFVRSGETLLGVEEPFNVSQLISDLQSAPFSTLSTAFIPLLHAVLAWSLFMTLAGPALYYVSLNMLRQNRARLGLKDAKKDRTV